MTWLRCHVKKHSRRSGSLSARSVEPRGRAAKDSGVKWSAHIIGTTRALSALPIVP